jgi:hypothetical protein
MGPPASQRPAKRRRIDEQIGVAVLIFIALALVAMLLLSHPARDSGVGGRAPTVEQRGR